MPDFFEKSNLSNIILDNILCEIQYRVCSMPFFMYVDCSDCTRVENDSFFLTLLTFFTYKEHMLEKMKETNLKHGGRGTTFYNNCL